jgi:hypothetical protein
MKSAVKSANPGLLANCWNLASIAVQRVDHFVSSLRPAKAIQGESEEESLLKDVVDLDRRDPAWYKPNLVIGAQQMLLNGSERSIVSAVYGDEITTEAATQLRTARPVQRAGASS